MTMAVRQFALVLPAPLVYLMECTRAIDRFTPIILGEDRRSATERDADLVHQCRDGDSEAFTKLVEKNQATVSRIMWRFSRDPAIHEELVQNVFVEVWFSLNSYSAKAPFEHWLARIATRTGYRHWTAGTEKNNTHLTPEQWALLAKDDLCQTDSTEAAELLYRLLARLSPRDRLILTLRYLENCSIKEAAHRAGWSCSMAKVQCWRAMRRLTRLLEKYRKETGI